MSIVEEVTLPASINLVQAYAFGYCINLKTVTAKMAKPCHAENAFEGIANTAALYVYPGLSEQFQNAEGWKVFTNIVEMEYTFKPGDANGDGVVSYSDVVAVLNRIIGGASDEHFVETAADVNNDGQVTVTDALMIVDMILEDEE
jgi:hypothetical protein